MVYREGPCISELSLCFAGCGVVDIEGHQSCSCQVHLGTAMCGSEWGVHGRCPDGRIDMRCWWSFEFEYCDFFFFPRSLLSPVNSFFLLLLLS